MKISRLLFISCAFILFATARRDATSGKSLKFQSGNTMLVSNTAVP